MFDKAFDNMQEMGKQWAAFSRKVTRGALDATSTSLESAARYLKDLREKVTEGADGGPTPENGAGSEHDTGSDAGA
jgi:hypothetical protein